MKNRLYAFSLALCCLLGATIAQAQNKLIKGRISDEKGAAISFASVSVKGSDIGTASNDSGLFEITVPSSIKSLNVSAVGFEGRDVALNGDFLDITLFGLSQNLEEVVVVGYGTQKVTKVSGAISTVKGAEIEKFKPVRTEDALQGRASGVTIISPGSPGAKPTVLIRGIPSYSGSEPIVVVDGNIQTLDDLNSISPADIESVNILKDAAGTAIYGVKGGNGVILVTTKTGRKNQKTEFTYSGMYGIQEVPNIIGVLNASEYAAIINEGSVASGGDMIFKDISQFGVGTNWQNEIFKQAPITQHALTARGGSEKMSYFISGAYLDQAGIVGGAAKSGFQRTTATANLIFDLSKKLRLFANNTYVNIKGRGISENAINGVISNALNFDPTVPIYNTNPNVYGRFSTSPNILSEIFNPLTQLDDTHNESNVNKLYGKLELQYTIIDGLKFNSRFGYTYTNISGRNFTPLSYYGDGHINSTLNSDGTARPGAHNNVSQNNTDFYSFLWENFATYNFKIKSAHNFDIVAGIANQKQGGKTIGGFAQDVPFNSWEFAYAQAATGVPQTGGRNFFANRFFERRNLSYFGRINYDYDGRFLVSFTGRRDGSNAFGKENRFANFYAASGGWVVSNENFWSSNFLDYFKIRGSYGVTGNENVTPQFQRISNEIYLYNLGQNAGYTFGNEPTTVGSTIASYRNESLSWERQNQFNFGFDLRFLKNKFNLSADYYRRDISGLLFNPTLSYYLGTAALPSANIGTTETKGIDITLGYNSKIGKKVNLNTYVTLTTVENLVTETNQGLITGGWYGIPAQSITRFEKGFPPGYFFGWKTNGIFQNETDIKNGAVQDGAQPGDIRFVDINGDGVINADDRTQIGNPFPKFTMGWGLNLDWKGFDFTTFWYGSFGNDVYRAYERNLAMTNKNRMVLGRWTGEGTTNDARFPRYSFVDDNLNTRASDRYIEDGSFVKIKDLQLGYSFASDALRKLKISKLRAFMQVRNAFTFTNYSGYDPEIAGGIFDTGIDRGIFPQARTWSFGVDVKF
jgi:TonB-dependent starch-binding outer membrane protein SusC